MEDLRQLRMVQAMKPEADIFLEAVQICKKLKLNEEKTKVKLVFKKVVSDCGKTTGFFCSALPMNPGKKVWVYFERNYLQQRVSEWQRSTPL